MKQYLKPLFLLSTILFSYYLTFYLLPSLKIGISFGYILRSLFWFVIAKFAIFFSSRHEEHKLEYSYSLAKTAFWTGFLYTAIFFLSGFVYGFGESPYDLTLKGMLINAMLVLGFLLGIEFSRAYFVKFFSRKFFLSSLVLTALLFTFVEISPGVWGAERKPQEMIVFLASRPLPLFSQHLLASLLVFLGGPLASIYFRGVLLAFEWFSPILPNPSWIFKSFFAVTFSVIAMLVIGTINREKLPSGESKEEGLKGAISWVAVGIAGVLIVWFFSGVFTYKPVLIAGRSMEPSIKIGDIAVGTKALSRDLKVGDVIIFVKERGKIVHRIVKIEKTGEGLLFFTRGDANRVADSDPVREAQIIGKVAFVIPKLGWVAIGLKNLVNLII